MELALVREWDGFLAAQGLSDETRRAYRYGLLRFLTEACPPTLRGIEERHVSDFLRSLGRRATAKRAYMAGMRSFFRWCQARGHVERDPTMLLSPKPPAKPPVVSLDPHELTLIFCAAYEQHPRRAWTLMLSFGLGTRRMETQAIQPEDVQGDEVYLRETKGGRPRRVPLSEAARVALEQLRPWYNGTVLGGISRQTITNWAHEAAIAAGLYEKVKGRTSHIFRATYATMLLEKGVPISVVSQLLGHTSVGITTRYLAVTAKDKRAGVARLDLKA